jgi:hypothetical protein
MTQVTQTPLHSSLSSCNWHIYTQQMLLEFGVPYRHGSVEEQWTDRQLPHSMLLNVDAPRWSFILVFLCLCLIEVVGYHEQLQWITYLCWSCWDVAGSQWPPLLSIPCNLLFNPVLWCPRSLPWCSALPPLTCVVVWWSMCHAFCLCLALMVQRGFGVHLAVFT